MKLSVELEHIQSLLNISWLHIIMPNIWFSDKSWILSNCIVHKTATALLGIVKRDGVISVNKHAYPVKVHVWPAVATKGIIGLYLFHKSGNSVNPNPSTYHDCISWFMKELETSKQYKNPFSAGSASASYRFINKNKHFPHKIVGNHLNMPWPFRSPDLTPADSYLLPTLKQSIYTKVANFKSLASLKRAITY